METNRLLSLKTKLTPWVGAACFSCSTEDGMLGHSSTNGREVVVRGYTQAGSWRTLGDNRRQWYFQKIKIISVCCLFSVHAHRFSVARGSTRESRAVKVWLESDSGCNMWRRPWKHGPARASSTRTIRHAWGQVWDAALGPGWDGICAQLQRFDNNFRNASYVGTPILATWTNQDILKHISALAAPASNHIICISCILIDTSCLGTNYQVDLGLERWRVPPSVGRQVYSCIYLGAFVCYAFYPHIFYRPAFV